MRTLLGVAAALVLAVGLAGCQTPSTSSAKPCESCKWGVKDTATKEGRLQTIWYCQVDGKKMDCEKDPAGCPGCAKK